jgi:two-component system, OmpR family, response regulator
MEERILIIEDDPETAAAVRAVVEGMGCAADHRDTLESGVAAAMARLRAGGSTALILVLSALGRAANRVEGLEKGADDYLPKPFEADELRARLRALLRRGTMQVLDNDLMAFGDLEIRLKARTVHVRRAHVPVSPKEFELLTYFARNAGQVVTRMQLLESVWNLHFDPGTNVVDVHVGRLRRKLEEAGSAAIQTARGEGYVFAPVVGATG